MAGARASMEEAGPGRCGAGVEAGPGGYSAGVGMVVVGECLKTQHREVTAGS